MSPAADAMVEQKRSSVLYDKGSAVEKVIEAMIVIVNIIDPAKNTCTPISVEERSGERMRGDGVDGGVIQDLENNALMGVAGTEFTPLLLSDSGDGSNRMEVKSAKYPENSCRFGTPAVKPKASASMLRAMAAQLNL